MAVSKQDLVDCLYTAINDGAVDLDDILQDEISNILTYFKNDVRELMRQASEYREDEDEDELNPVDDKVDDDSN